MNAYGECYLDEAMDSLGEAFDYAADCCNIDLDLFLSMLIASGFAARFERAEPKIIAGMSGTDLAIEVLCASGMRLDFPPAKTEYSYSAEYWCGWIIAYCQWRTSRPFVNIRRYMTMQEVRALYGPLHEADEERFMSVFNDRVRHAGYSTRLQEQRKISGLTQRQLSEKAEVNLRTLQQYENRAKSINKAAGDTLRNLARVLGVRMEDLLEYD